MARCHYHHGLAARHLIQHFIYHLQPSSRLLAGVGSYFALCHSGAHYWLLSPFGIRIQHDHGLPVRRTGEAACHLHQVRQHVTYIIRDRPCSRLLANSFGRPVLVPVSRYWSPQTSDSAQTWYPVVPRPLAPQWVGGTGYQYRGRRAPARCWVPWPGSPT